MADIVDKYAITVDTDGAIKSLERFEGAQKDVNETSKDQEQALGDAAKSAINYAAKLAVAYEAAKKVGAVLLDSVKAAAESERAQRDLSSAIRLVGGDVGKLLPRFLEQATALQRLTGLQDEQIQSLQSQALRYGAATGDVEKLVEASIRLANVTGQDVDSAMQGLIRTTQGVQDRTLALVPGVRELTEEQLRNGDAIRIVNERFAESLDALAPTEKAWRDFDNAVSDIQESLGGFLIDAARVPDILRGMTLALDEVTAAARDFGSLEGALVAANIALFGGDAVLERRERIVAERLAKAAAERRKGGLTHDMLADAGGGAPLRPAQAPGAPAKPARATGGGKPEGPGFTMDIEGSGREWVEQEIARTNQLIDAKLAARLRGVELEASIEDQRLAMLDEKWQQEQAMQAQASNAMLQTTLAASQAASSVGIQSLIRWASGAKVSAREVGAAMVATFGQQLVSQGTLHLWSGIAGTLDPLMGNPALIGVGLKEIAIGGAMAAAGGRMAGHGGGGAGGGGGSPRQASAGGFQGGVGGGSEVGRNTSGERKITVIVEGWMSPEEAGHRTKKAIEESNRVGL